jgi:hypothetical protein
MKLGRPTVQAPSGVNIVVGAQGEGKSMTVQLPRYARSEALKNYSYEEDASTHVQLGGLASTCHELLSAVLGVDLSPTSVVANTGDNQFSGKKTELWRAVGAKVAKALDQRKGSSLRTAMFIESDEIGSDADVVIEAFGRSFTSPLSYSAVFEKQSYALDGPLGAMIILGCINPVTVSSATPAMFNFTSIPNANVKGGLNTAFLDTINVVNSTAIKLHSSVIAEVRDDWGDFAANQVLRGAGRTYVVIEALEVALEKCRVRGQPGVHSTSADKFFLGLAEDVAPYCKQWVQQSSALAQKSSVFSSRESDGFKFNGQGLLDGKQAQFDDEDAGINGAALSWHSS